MAYFNPPPPCGGRRMSSSNVKNRHLFQSTSPVWRTTVSVSVVIGLLVISIHVPRVEDDRYPRGSGGYMRYFNPRPPCGGRRIYNWRIYPRKHISIHVPRVEDDSAFSGGTDLIFYFNPRPPCGGRPKNMADFVAKELISIHVPRVEDDRDSAY